MEKIAALTFVRLDGEPPAGVALDRLPDSEAVFGRIRDSLAPFLTPDAMISTITFEPMPANGTGLHLIYAYGHAWLADGTIWTAAPCGADARLESGRELLERLIGSGDPSRTILVLDTCHAAAFSECIPQASRPRLVIFGSAADESALALYGDQISRLSAAFAMAVGRNKRRVDLTIATIEVAEKLDNDGVIEGQTVSYLMHGSPVQLARADKAQPGARARTVGRIRNLLIGSGALVALILVALGWFYWSHVLVDVDVRGLASIATDVRVEATVESPGDNGSALFRDLGVNGSHARFWAPAEDLIIRVEAHYTDGAERGLAFPMTLRPGFSARAKTVDLVIPLTADVLAHPNMAFIPSEHWVRGADRAQALSRSPFWIDLGPPTVEAYLPMAEKLVADGRLEPDNAVLVQQTQRSSAVDAVGLQQLRGLNAALGQAFGVINAANAQRVTAPGDIAVGLGETPCAHCPAPMTHVEATLYCASRGMRLPTDDEWELAARGVDGRMYPWGNQFDPKRANVPGLPQKGDPPPGLKPVAAYPNGRSPCGLLDTVGNAGDWVAGDPDANQTYMGATFRFNPEDATVFRETPVTEDYSSVVQWITARCVADTVGQRSKKTS